MPSSAACCTETVTHAFKPFLTIFVTSMLPIQQFFALASASHR
nr:MAG TPA: hypothetical protein [Caudoviricetes sp.]